MLKLRTKFAFIHVAAAFGWALLLACQAFPAGGATPEVVLERTPDGGVQPQIAVDDTGTVHLVYLKGEASTADVYYARRTPDAKGFSQPLRVNSETGSAIATGTIRGAQIAVGKNGRVHVAWNGSPKSSMKTERGMPMLYARLNDAGTAFETQRDLMTGTMHLDGGGSVAADRQGNVYVAWHGSPVNDTKGEAGRAVYIAKSADDGKTFAPEAAAISTPTGACGCCGMRTAVDQQGNVFAVYRAATQVLNRDILLLSSADQGRTFSLGTLQKWKIGKCPMSSEALLPTPAGLIGAWEVNDQVHFGRLDAKNQLTGAPVMVPTTASKSRHPALAANAKGDLLVAWTEGTAWQKGGSVAWQAYDTAGKAAGKPGRSDGVPVWGSVAAYARVDGNFVLLY